MSTTTLPMPEWAGSAFVMVAWQWPHEILGTLRTLVAMLGHCC
jgi:hypothetical protein